MIVDVPTTQQITAKLASLLLLLARACMWYKLTTSLIESLINQRGYWKIHNLYKIEWNICSDP